MNTKYFKTKLKTLTWCIEDWTDLHSILCFVREFYNYEDLELIKITTLEIVQNLLEEKLVIAGDLLKGNIFKTWNKKTDEIIQEIKNKWDSLDRKLVPFEIVCFEITDKGREEFEYLNSLPELKETDPFYFDDK